MSTQVTMPAEVLDFFERTQSLNDPDLGIHILDAQKSLTYSQAFKNFSPTAELELVALDDADDSNPHCYIGNGPAAGMVLHYRHDDAPEIRYSSLDVFRSVLEHLVETGTALWEIAEETRKPIDPIPGLASTMRDLLTHCDADHAEWLLCLYLPHTPLEESGLADQLASHASYFVREALAGAIAEHAHPQLLDAAQKLSADKNPQVARPGKKALGAVRRAIHEHRR